MYERFIAELKSYSKAIRILSKGYLPITLIPPSKLQLIISQVKMALAKTNKDYDLVLSRLYLYYDMCARAQLISQYADARQLNIPT